MARIQKKEKPKPKPSYKEYISESEFKARRKAWSEYYAKVPETRAYKRYQEMRQALKDQQVWLVKKLKKEARQQRAEEEWELTKPPYEDPDIERRYKRLGVREWDTDTDIVAVARGVFGV